MIASEQKLKWYAEIEPGKFEPAYEVPTKKGDKMTKVTLTQARPRGFLPSVTSVDDIVESFSLTQYKRKQVVLACIEFPYDRPDKSEQNIDEYMEMMLAKSEEHAGAAADRGTALHADVEKYITTGVEASDPVGQKMSYLMKKWLDEQGVDTVSCEECIGSRELGYAGTPDIYATGGEKPLIIDLKTTNTASFKKPYTSWKRQLGAYRNLKADEADLWQAVGDRNTGDLLFIPHEDPDRWAEAYSKLFDFWCLEVGYDPRKAEAA